MTEFIDFAENRRIMNESILAVAVLDRLHADFIDSEKNIQYFMNVVSSLVRLNLYLTRKRNSMRKLLNYCSDTFFFILKKRVVPIR